MGRFWRSIRGKGEGRDDDLDELDDLREAKVELENGKKVGL